MAHHCKLDGPSYEIEHVSIKRKEKKHALDLSPYPAELITFQPLNGANNQCGQLNRKISDHPYEEAGTKGFTPPNPFRVATNFITTTDALVFKWPTLAKLNKELFPYPWSYNKEFNEYLSNDSPSTIPGFYTGPPPLVPNFIAPTIRPSAVLAQQIIKSSDKFFFISNSIGYGDVQEWHLVCVAFEALMASYSSCLVDGQYLVDFYISHPSDYQYNAINKRFQYNIAVRMTLWPIQHRLILICFNLLTHLKPMLTATNSSLFGNISTSLIRTHSFMDRLTLLLSVWCTPMWVNMSPHITPP
jgi:hypothetical protein